MARNARFWIYFAGSYVKLTLQPGQTLSTHEGRNCDEGFYSESVTYQHARHAVTREWHERGRDCDGRYSRGGESYCPMSDLQSRENYESDGPRLPEWQHGDASQVDETAELAGY